MRVFLVVIDSFGIGAMSDAEKYGDAGSDTYGHLRRKTGLRLPTLARLGLNAIDGVDPDPADPAPIGRYARLLEKTPAKDTTAGHFELAGLPLEKPFPVYPNAFPKPLVETLERACGCRFIGNEVASGTEIVARLGEEQTRTGRPILYTSQDSVLQIAANVDETPLERLYEICRRAREAMTGEHSVGRVIARPFRRGENGFFRTADRRDFALPPPGVTMLDRLTEAGKEVVAIGKIADIFTGRGISRSYHTSGNGEGLALIERCMEEDGGDLFFCNLVDTDMLFGHRNDPEGYASALREIDRAAENWLSLLEKEDCLLVTADHGCDPTTPSTDHSREAVPLLAYRRGLEPKNFGTVEGFDFVARSILDLFQIEYYANSIFRG